MALSLNIHHLARYKEIGALLIKHGRASSDVASSDDEGEATEADAVELADKLESMGPTFIKLGQLLSTRSDLLPPVYLSALARLQDDVEPVPFEQIEETVTSEIGARISKAFVSFDATPAASASLGQVHHAVLRNGRRVAVKVQRPGVRKQVVEDMEVIEELAEFVDRGARDACAVVIEYDTDGKIVPVVYIRRAGTLTEHVLPSNPLHAFDTDEHRNELAARVAPLLT